jgi:hypothetical protein
MAMVKPVVAIMISPASRAAQPAQAGFRSGHGF